MSEDMWHLENTYLHELPEQFYHKQSPEIADTPELVCFNESLARELDVERHLSNRDYAQGVLSGSTIPAGAQPIAQAYAGHQFGQFTMLGDGRAILLGEHVAKGNRFDIQLKGSGRTKFSRNGDGRATLSSMLREYLMSEALHYLGIPTTRSLAVVKTGKPVYREEVQAGAVLTRVAQSHIRVGTVEYARYFCPPEQLEALVQYIIKRHYPELSGHNDYAVELLKAVMDKQIDLLVHWMRVGFIHGVMNTDNMSVAGETIDYGPCAFMNDYHPDTVFSSIDRQGRYSYVNQPRIAHWNLSILANALLPLVDKKEEEAVSKVKEVLNMFPEEFSNRYISMMCRKLGIVHEEEADKTMVNDLLVLLAKYKVDYTNFFVSLRNQSISDEELVNDQSFKQWHKVWKKAHERSDDQKAGLDLMDKNNPVIIPRNHLVEQALEQAASGDQGDFELLLRQLSEPYAQHNELQTVPNGYDQRYQTFCGT